jgi:hypothetical protein
VIIYRLRAKLACWRNDNDSIKPDTSASHLPNGAIVPQTLEIQIPTDGRVTKNFPKHVEKTASASVFYWNAQLTRDNRSYDLS